MTESAANDDHLGPVTREGILTETLRLHDLHHGIDHCDRKYVQVCSQFQSLLFEAGKNLRTPPGQTPSDGDAWRIVAARDGEAWPCTIVDRSGRSLLGIVNGTPVIRDRALAERVLAALNIGEA